MEKKFNYSINAGDYLIIMITGFIGVYVAEVTQSEPLRMKVEEHGPLTNLKEDDYIIIESDTEDFQQNYEDYLAIRKPRQLLSGLKSIGVTDNNMHEILLPTKKQ